MLPLIRWGIYCSCTVKIAAYAAIKGGLVNGLKAAEKK
jgi:hypothetical protein